MKLPHLRLQSVWTLCSHDSPYFWQTLQPHLCLLWISMRHLVIAYSLCQLLLCAAHVKFVMVFPFFIVFALCAAFISCHVFTDSCTLTMFDASLFLLLLFLFAYVKSMLNSSWLICILPPKKRHAATIHRCRNAADGTHTHIAQPPAPSQWL